MKVGSFAFHRAPEEIVNADCHIGVNSARLPPDYRQTATLAFEGLGEQASRAARLRGSHLNERTVSGARHESAGIAATSGFFQEKGVVQETGEEASGERTHPVNSMILPMGRGQGRAESASGVERATGEGTGHKNTEDDANTDGESGDRPKRRPFIDRGSEDREYKEKSGNAFHNHARET